MKTETAINHWNIFRDTHRIRGTSADGFTISMGKDQDFIDANDFGPYHYGYLRVEEALSSLCKLRSQRETLTQLVVHVYAKGLPVKAFNGANYGWDHEHILTCTLDAILDAVDQRIKAVPPPERRKEVEVA
jgi:hypothetical protein